MKNIIKGLFVVAGLAVFGFMACNKNTTNQTFGNGSAPTMKLSSTTLAPTPADSSNAVLAISWTNPHYATDSATELYSIQIDSSGRNFSKAVTIAVSGALADSLTGKQINTIALGFGFAYRVAYNMDVRVISSYANNNQQFFSNTVTISYTPYVIPPKIVPPTGLLYLVGAASQGGWNAPVPVPTQVFEKVDSVDYAGVFNLIGNQQFLILPQNTGSYDNKLATNDASETGSGGAFAYNDNNNFTGPTASGWYTIWLNFQTGNFTITPYTQPIIPDSLFIVGNATAGGWNNPVPDPGQALTHPNSTQFTITLPLSAAGQYLLLPVNGDWTNKFAVASGTAPVTGGAFGYNGSNGTFNTNFNGPANAGTYTVTADFLNYTYTVTQ